MSCEKVALLYSRSRSQWRLGAAVNFWPNNISDQINLIWWCIIMSQRIREIFFCYFQCQGHSYFHCIFRSTETFTTQISLMMHHHKMGLDTMKRYYCFYSGRETEDVAWVTMVQIVATLGHPDISSRGQYQFQSRKCGQNIAFVMNILVY